MLSQRYGQDWTALAYMQTAAELVTTIITPDDIAIASIANDVELQELIARATEPLYRRHTYRDFAYLQGQTSTRWKVLRSLGERLIPPSARARLHPDHRLIVVPAGRLHGLPWAALRMDDAWLGASAVVQIDPSLAVWCILARRQPRSDAALLVGCSDFGQRAPALPDVQAELQTIAEHWAGPADRLCDRQATRAALHDRSARADLAGRGLLHFATHARMLPNRGLAAHIKLYDGDLLLPEIVDLNLAGCLVVLSTCEGAAADLRPGDELLSLSWALLAAGARGVLASLWRVPDAAAQRFMVLFYVALGACRDPSLALARAQRSMLDTELAPGDSLDIWASFVFTGSA